MSRRRGLVLMASSPEVAMRPAVHSLQTRISRPATALAALLGLLGSLLGATPGAGGGAVHR